MYSALHSGRWSLLRAAWAFHVEEARRWSGAGPLTEREQDALVLSGAAEWVYGQWLDRAGIERAPDPEDRGRPVLISWTGTTDRLAAVLAGPGYLGSMWKEALEGQRVQAALIDANGQVTDRLVTRTPGRPYERRLLPDCPGLCK